MLVRASAGGCGLGPRRGASPRAGATPVLGDITAAREGRRAAATLDVFPEPRPALLGAPGLALSETQYLVPPVTLPSPSINEHPAARLLPARLRSLARCRSPSRDPVAQFAGAQLRSPPSHPHWTRPGHRVADGAGTTTAGRDKPFPMPLRSRHPQRPRAGSPSPFPARCMPTRGAAEGETRDLTWSDSSRSRDINLVCHSAVSRRSAAWRGHDSPQTPGSRADGCRPPPRFAPQGPSPHGPGSSWGGLGGAAGRAAPAAPCPRGCGSSGSCRCPSTELENTEPPGTPGRHLRAAPSLDLAGEGTTAAVIAAPWPGNRTRSPETGPKAGGCSLGPRRGLVAGPALPAGLAGGSSPALSPPAS